MGEPVMRVLLLDPTETRRNETAGLLARDGHVVEAADDTDDAIQLGQLTAFDLVIIECGPDGDSAATMVQALRRNRITTPVVVLSDPVPAAVRIRVISLGADDYVSRPFDAGELFMRMTAVVRRTHGLSDSVVAVGQLRLDLTARSVEIDGRPLSLTPKEYAVLEILVLRHGHVMARETLLDHLYGGLDERHEKVIDVYICRLRHKLQRACGGGHYLQTEWGRGFVLREPRPLAA